MAHNIQPLLNKAYLKAKSAQGVYITDENGKSYLDGSSGAVTCSVGHSHPKVLEAMRQQAGRLQFVYRSQFGSEEAERLATKLFSLSPGQAYAHTFFVNSGTEAIETAMKIALQYFLERGQPKKTQFISRWKSYHGITMGALSLSGHPLRRQRFESSLQKFPGLSANLEGDPTDKHEQELRDHIRRIGAENIAAFVAEPIVGAAGTALTPAPDYYPRMKAVCRDHDILFIADEVMTGLGRTGKWFGLDHWKESADIVAVGKSLGAGYAPIAATLMTDAVLEPIRKGTGLIMSGHTYSGHPLSCATALRVLEVVEEEHLLQNVNDQGDYLKANLQALQRRFPVIRHVRGKGLLLGVEFDPAQKGFQAKLIDRCFDNGLLVYPSVGGPEGKDENGILVTPPFNINRGQCDELLEKLVDSMANES
ncbi:MAG: aspartate aminotransferase family protein [Cyclobacteriaceae bacterium]|nr:aspartate aminotransferase family protein [Cyclobacteriaceae bacterium]